MEKIIRKQTFLEQNDIFNPKKYFGGLDNSNLTHSNSDPRLEGIYYYLKQFSIKKCLDKQC